MRSGNYTVYGLARSPEKASILTAAEITPIIGDISDPETYMPLVRSTPIDLIIDCGTAYASATALISTLHCYARSRRETLAKEGFPAAPKLAYLVLSGTWVHGSPSGGSASDLHVPGSKGKAAPVVAWRPEHEQAVLAARDELDVAIVRPAAVHIRGSWLWDSLWAPLLANSGPNSSATGPVRIPLPADARPGVVHLDDVVSGIHAVADRIIGAAGLGSWPVFDLVTETLSMRAILERVAECVGCESELEFVGLGEDPLLQGMALRTNGGADRARIVLGWEPQRRDFLGEMPVFVRAWKAEKEIAAKKT